MLIMEENAAAFTRPFLLGHGQVARATRRCLFGRADPEETRAIVREELEQIYQEQKSRWNFDFEREVPLPGRFEWEPIGNSSPQESRTELRFKGSTTSSVGCQKTSPPALTAQEVVSAASPSVVQSSSHLVADEQSTATEKPLRQLQITEMLKTRKRPRESVSGSLLEPCSKKPASDTSNDSSSSD